MRSLEDTLPQAFNTAYAEERRLFYVALTRAKLTVSLIMLRYKISPFVAELIKNHNLATSDLTGENNLRESCPEMSVQETDLGVWELQGVVRLCGFAAMFGQ